MNEFCVSAVLPWKKKKSSETENSVKTSQPSPQRRKFQMMLQQTDRVQFGSCIFLSDMN